MGDLKARLLRYAAMPPGMLWRKLAHRLGNRTTQAVLRAKDRYCSSYASARPVGPLFPHLDCFPLQQASAQAETLKALAEHCLAHRFDLLGSGWVPVRHGVECPGVEGHRYEASGGDSDASGRINPANRRESSRVRALIGDNYLPIDWQLDFKSGFRWREDCWYRDIAIITGRPGVDIKVPWELARCQHLPQLALAHGLAKAGIPGFRDEAEYRSEFRNQVLDFIAANPPRFGVNWACPMDVGIRIANWLLAYDLFIAGGAEFDAPFAAVLDRSIYEHGLHIAENLEWNESFRSNHYLADLAGLLFAGAHLPGNEVTDGWIRKAAIELLIEIPAQFNEDGSNFEASTCYHRLSAEMAVYAVALMLSVLRQRLPLPWRVPPSRPGGSPASPETVSDLFPRGLTGILERAAEFSMHATGADGRVVQIGDNDSGRFFKLQPAGRFMQAGQVRKQQENLAGYAVLGDGDPFWLEDSLDQRHLVGAIGALFSRRDLADFAGPFDLDAAVILALAGKHRFPGYRDDGQPARAAAFRMGTGKEFSGIRASLLALPDANSRSYRFPLAETARQSTIQCIGYPNFGLFVLRAQGFYLAVRCGPHGQAGNGGHAHNDQLAVELVINGKTHARDPGTYLYTALPERRNEYRAAAAHFAPRIAGREPGNLALPFSLPEVSHAKCLYFGPLGFIGTHRGYGLPVYRVIAFGDGHVEIRDYAEGATLDACRFTGRDGGYGIHLGPPFSAGYGMREYPFRDN